MLRVCRVKYTMRCHIAMHVRQCTQQMRPWYNWVALIDNYSDCPDDSVSGALHSNSLHTPTHPHTHTHTSTHIRYVCTCSIHVRNTYTSFSELLYIHILACYAHMCSISFLPSGYYENLGDGVTEEKGICLFQYHVFPKNLSSILLSVV